MNTDNVMSPLLIVNSQSGHAAKDCPEPPNMTNVDCRKCGESKLSLPNITGETIV